MVNVMEIFAIRLKELRELSKDVNSEWTQEYVAKKIGVARTTYTAYENGTKQPTLTTLIHISELFNVTTDYLLGRSNSK